MTCPRKYCLIDTCTSNANAEHHEGRRLYIEPDDNVDIEQFRTYEPPEPVSVADQVECIAGNTAMYSCVLILISAALQLTVFGDSSDSIVLIITIIFFAAMFISIAVAAVAEHFPIRHTPARTEPRPDELR
jgi:hypothetical protein